MKTGSMISRLSIIVITATLILSFLPEYKADASFPFLQRNANIEASELEDAIAYVQANTTIAGTVAGGIVATFPAAIPQVLVDAGYQINSRITLGEVLPGGTTVTITRDGSPYLTNAAFTGTQHWVTDLFGYPLSYAASFNHDYDGQVETYMITFQGDLVDTIDTTLTLESIISSDVFVSDLVILESAAFELNPALDEALALVQSQTTISGTLANLTATFGPNPIPEIVASAGFRINSQIILSDPLPAGSKVTVVKDGFTIVNQVALTSTTFWITDLMGLPLSISEPFDHTYDGLVEEYSIIISGNPYAINTTVTVNSVISRDLFTTEMVILDAVTLPLTVAADEDAALALVQAQTTLSGSLENLTAVFPTLIPPVITAEPYHINSRMTLASALPAGSRVTIYVTVDGIGPFLYVDHALIPGTQFWITDLLPGSVPADFDANYGGHVEIYSITISSGGGNPLAVDTSVNIASIISKDDFTTNVILAEITLPVHLDADEDAAIAWMQSNMTITGDLQELIATFPPSIPPVILATGYQVNSRMSLVDSLHLGTTVAIEVKIGDTWYPYVTATDPPNPFWITELFEPDAIPAMFDADYGGRIETYRVTITGPGTNPLDFDTTLKIQSIISKDSFETNIVLGSLDLIPVHINADEDAALLSLQGNTTITGDLDALTATFPLSIPPVIVAEDYVIDSRMTLAAALPEGSTVDVYREGVKVLSGITLSGSGPFWFTQLFNPDAPRAAFNAYYGSAVEHYRIIVLGPGTNPLDFDTTLKIESVISKDDYATETVLAELDLVPVHIDADEDAALAWVRDNMSITGSLQELTATFPASIPPIIVAESYRINSKMTLLEPLPAGTSVSIKVKIGETWIEYVTAVDPPNPFWITQLFEPDATPAAFDANYGGKVEIYAVTISGNPTPVNTEVLIQSIISKDDFRTEFVLDEITLPVVAADIIAPALSITGIKDGTTALPGDQVNGFTLETTGDPATAAEHALGFTEGTSASEPLADDYFGLYLVESTVNITDLQSYFANRGLPALYLDYLIDAAAGSNPFAYISGVDITLLDAAKHNIDDLDVPLAIPDDFPNGSYTFSGKINDPSGNESDVSFILVISGNRAPVGYGDSYTTGEDTLLTIGTLGVLDNDTDINDDILSAILVDDALHGDLNLASDGSFTYLPDGNWHGSDQFTYQAFDGKIYSAEIEVEISVSSINDPPVLDTIADITRNEGFSISFSASATDIDLPGDTLAYSLVGDIPMGAFINPVSGYFFWSPSEEQGPSVYTIQVQACDNGLPSLCDTEEFTITVNEVNIPPVLGNIADRTIDENSLFTFSATAEDLDVPANPLAFSIIGSPDGAVIDPTSGNFTWTPTEAQGEGSYTFQTCVSDGKLVDCQEITLHVDEVNASPILEAIGDQFVHQEKTLTLTILATDSDIPVNELTYSVEDAPYNATIDPMSGQFSWTPDETNLPGEYDLTFKVCDNGVPSLCDQETVTITVHEPNQIPEAFDQALSTDEDTPLVITLTATDVESSPLTWTIVDPPDHGALSGNAPDLTYTPVLNYYGSDQFEFKVNDGADDSNTAIIAITINPVNDAPVANYQSLTTPKNTPLHLILWGSDVEGDTADWEIITYPVNGELSCVFYDCIYTPDDQYTGTDYLEFKIKEDKGEQLESNVARIDILVTGYSVFLPLIIK